jgi:hypothetical protein
MTAWETAKVRRTIYLCLLLSWCSQFVIDFRTNQALKRMKHEGIAGCSDPGGTVHLEFIGTLFISVFQPYPYLSELDHLFLSASWYNPKSYIPVMTHMRVRITLLAVFPLRP